MKPSIEEIEFHGIAALRLNGPQGASAVISKLGAQVLSWITPDGRERLFLSDKAVFDGSVAIRGGIPVCWPQFAGLGDLPKHGFVRTREWQVSARRCGDDYALLTLELADDEALACGCGVALHTPGHTPGSMSFWFPQAKLLIAGDTLFKRGIGRTDLWGGDYPTIERSIRQRLYTLDEEATVVTGHGPDTRLGDEMRENPFVRA